MTPRRRRRRPEAMGAVPLAPVGWLAQNHLLVGLLAAIVLALIAQTSWLSAPARTLLLQVDVLGLLLLLALSGPYPDDLRVAACRGPHPFLLALLAWCVVSAGMAANRSYAAAELLRVLLCAAVYFGAAYGLRTTAQLRLAVGAVLVIGVAAAVHVFAQFGSESRQTSSVVGIFGTHENLGSFLIVSLLPALALALGRRSENNAQLGAQVAALVLGGALLLSRTRSAWIGAIAALVTLTFLFVRYRPRSLNARSGYAIIAPLLVVTLGLAVLVIGGEIAPLLSTRAATLGRLLQDQSFEERLHLWRSAARMTAERPVTGWGLGSWPLLQGRWTHHGDDALLVLERGTGHSNIAHNYWAQWAAETGGVGLALHVALLGAFVLSALRALPAIPSNYRQTLLMGCIAVCVGAAVDAVGAPSYNFVGISVLPWFWMGIGVAMCRETRQPHREASSSTSDPALPATRPGVWWGAAAAGLAAALLVVGVGCLQLLQGRSAPRGTLYVTAVPSGPAPPGTRVSWIAVYKDPSGKMSATWPGASWTITGGRLNNAGPAYLLQKQSGDTLAVWQGSLPRGMPSVKATVTFWDAYSRRYQASATVSIRAATPVAPRRGVAAGP